MAVLTGTFFLCRANLTPEQRQLNCCCHDRILEELKSRLARRFLTQEVEMVVVYSQEVTQEIAKMRCRQVNLPVQLEEVPEGLKTSTGVRRETEEGIAKTVDFRVSTEGFA